MKFRDGTQMIPIISNVSDALKHAKKVKGVLVLLMIILTGTC